MINNEKGISTATIIGLVFVGLIAVTVITKIISGDGFNTQGVATPGSHLTRNLDASTNSQNQATGANAGKLAPDFTLTSLDGRQISLADYRGQKPVVLDFFATWCPNCRRDMPKQQALYEKYGEDLEVIAINLNESQKKVEKFVTNNGFTFPVVMDPSGHAARTYQVNYTNTHIYINKDGFIDHTNYQDTTDNQFASLVN